MAADWYPGSIHALAPWWANFATQIIPLATKYGISAPVLAEIAADNAWIQYWVQARHDADALKQQLTKYFNEIAGTNPALPEPAPVNFVLSGTPPAEVPPGIEFRIRKIARDMKNSMVFAQADGELLGIVTDKEIPDDLNDSAPEFTLKTLTNFQLEATFRKYGADAIKFEFRHKGGNWMPAGFLVTSPGVFAVMPSEPGVAEQIEARAFFIIKNAVVGNASATQTAFIAP